MKQFPTGILGAIVALSVLGVVGNNSREQRSDEASRQVATGKKVGPPAGRLPFRSLGAGAKPILEMLCNTVAGSKDDCLSDLKNNDARIDYVIAVVPDPKHTQLALFFDRTMEAIQQAAADELYVFRGAYTPWDDREHAEPSALQERLRIEDYQRLVEDSPGVLIFDRPHVSDRPCAGNRCSGRDLLVTFVVGERPTAGINKKQFRMAGALVRALQSFVEPRRQSEPLHLFGPTFSGSLVSLDQLTKKQEYSCQGPTNLANKKVSNPRISIVAFSGTVTGESSKEVLEECRTDVVFASFQDDDDLVVKKVQTFFTKPDRRTRNQIAVLSEDETAYGSDPRDQGVVRLYFPREISHLRSAYQEAHTTRSPSQKDSSRTTLPLDLQNTGADDDTVSVFSKKQLPLSQEAVLLGLVSRLRAGHISLILIRATDPLDQLFLAKYLRVAYPQGRLIMIGSDSLFRREIQDSDLLGTLAVSNYFDFPRRQDCANSNLDVETRVFPSANSAGSYQAFRVLLKTIAAQSNSSSAAPLTRRDIQRYIPKPPCLTLAALGHDGYWPIATLDAKLAPTDKRPMPVGWQVFQTAVALLAIAYSVVLLRPSIFDPEESVAMMARVPGEGRTGVVATLSMLSLAIVWIALWPNVVINEWPRSTKLVAMAGVILVAITAYDLFRRLKRDSPGSPETKLELGLRVLLTALVPAAVTLVVWSTSRVPDTETKYFAMYRSVHLSSGLSPILPLILLCCAGWWWAFHTIAGSTLLDRRKTLLPRGMKWRTSTAAQEEQTVTKVKAQVATGETLEIIDCGGRTQTVPSCGSANQDEISLRPVMSILHDQHAGLMNILRPNYLDWKIVASLVGCLFGVLMVIQVRYPVLSLESVAYDRLLALLITGAMVALIGTTLRVRRIWIELRPLLISLDSIPFRKAFSRIRHMRCIELWRIGGDVADFKRAVSRQYEALQAATGAYLPVTELGPLEKIRGDMVETFKSMRNRKTQFAQATRAANDAGPLVDKFEIYQQEMADLARSALMQLSPYWSSAEGRRRGDNPNADANAAEDFVALLYSNFLSIVLTRIRSLIVAISGMYVFTLIALSMYPFEQRTTIRAVLVAVLCFMFSVVAFVYSGIHRDTIVSILTNTKPGELGGMFWLKMFSFAALPVFSFAAAQFPELNSLLFSWAEPALQAFGR